MMVMVAEVDITFVPVLFIAGQLRLSSHAQHQQW